MHIARAREARDKKGSATTDKRGCLCLPLLDGYDCSVPIDLLSDGEDCLAEKRDLDLVKLQHVGSCSNLYLSAWVAMHKCFPTKTSGSFKLQPS